MEFAAKTDLQATYRKATNYELSPVLQIGNGSDETKNELKHWRLRQMKL